MHWHNSSTSDLTRLKPIPTVVTTYNRDNDEQLSKKRANTEITNGEVKAKGLNYAAQTSQADNLKLVRSRANFRAITTTTFYRGCYFC